MKKIFLILFLFLAACSHETEVPTPFDVGEDAGVPMGCKDLRERGEDVDC